MNKTQNVVFKKVLTMLMAVMMVFTMMPSMAWADDSDSGNDVPSTTETITVYMTVSDQGKLALGKDSTVMAWVPVEYRHPEVPQVCMRYCRHFTKPIMRTEAADTQSRRSECGSIPEAPRNKP